MDSTPLTWHTEQRKVSDLIPFDGNPRKLNEKQVSDLKRSLEKFNLVEIPAINTTNKILAGHQRLKIMQLLGRGEELIDVRVPNRELTQDEEREYLVRSNKNTGDWDWDQLANFGADELIEWGFDSKELTKNFGLEEHAEADPIPEPPATPRALAGQVFTLGKHRIKCGDSTISEDVADLMAGAKADVVFTDPPYGVNVKGGAKGNKTIAGDLTQVAIPFSFDLAVQIATKDDARFYFCGGEGNLGLYDKLFDRFLRQLPRHIIWVKNGFVMKPNNYHNQYEIIYFGYKPKGGGLDHWYSGRTENEASDVWQIKRDPSGSYLHPTQKPLDVPRRAILNSAPHAGIVFDPFLGSGSTLIACEQTGRVCFGMELDPAYVDVIIKRYCNETGADLEGIYAGATAADAGPGPESAGPAATDAAGTGATTTPSGGAQETQAPA